MHKSKLLMFAALLATSGCSTQTQYLPSYNAAGPVTQGEGLAALPDGGVYRGQFKDGLFDGDGTLTWTNSSRYVGKFKSGLMHGKGVLTTPFGETYKGEFRNGHENGYGELTLAEGAYYKGEFKDGMFQGQGVFVASNGERYSGEFKDGQFSGRGVFVADDGSEYRGAFLNWKSHGQGELVLKRGDRYRGQFAEGQPQGEMVVEYKNGDRYEGGMLGWNYQGKGRYISTNGYKYEGRFENGTAVGTMRVSSDERGNLYEGELKNWVFHGHGILTSKDGSRYEGDFKRGVFDGYGTLDLKDGEHYEGNFSYGRYHGQGTLTFQDEDGKLKTLSGRWRNGQYVGDDAAAYMEHEFSQLNSEQILYDQPQKVHKALAKLLPQVPGRTDLYFVSFGGFGDQNVFMKEVLYASKVMDQLYNVGERTVQLINNRTTLNELPLATVTNLESVIKGIAARMDPEEDLLFLYITSHGSPEHEISVELGDMPLSGLTAGRLQQLLHDSGIKWKVVLVSACYSGAFIKPLQDDYSLIMTAASANRQSFGCSDDSDLTYFGRAYFEKSLNSENSFEEAFNQARDLIAQWEIEEQREPSQPQIATSPAITHKLAEWRSQRYQ